jgi:histidine triad (HIT) family protein
MDSVFTKIIKGEIPAYKVAENENFFAFLDIHPNVKGHSLVIPKKQVDKLFDLDEETYQGLFSFAKKVAAGIEKSIPCDRVGLSVIGLEVPHAHVHLIPLNHMEDANFSNPKIQMTSEEFTELAKTISENIVL